MLTLKAWMELVDYKVTEGSDYFTNIKGLYSMSSWNEQQDGFFESPSVLAGVNAVNRAHVHTGGVLGADAGLGNDVRHSDGILHEAVGRML